VAAGSYLKLASLGVAVLLGQHYSVALFATVALRIGEACDAVLHWRQARQRRRLRRVIADAIAADAGRLDKGTLEAARIEAERLIRHYGPDERRFAAMGLDPEAAVGGMMPHLRLAHPGDAAEIAPACRRLLLGFYGAVRDRAAVLAELMPHLHMAHYQLARDQGRHGRAARGAGQDRAAVAGGCRPDAGGHAGGGC
jgi:hypothetical protein